MNTTQKTKPSYKKDLLLLFAAPVSIAIIAAGIIYVPKLLANPTYDFIYSVCGDYVCKDSYSIDSSGQISNRSYNANNNDNLYGGYEENDKYTELRYYDVDKGSSKAISLPEAQAYNLDSASKSPDGYILSLDHKDGGFLLWGDYSSDWYLKKGAQKKKVEISSEDYIYDDQIKFLGWVEK